MKENIWSSPSNMLVDFFHSKFKNNWLCFPVWLYHRTTGRMFSIKILLEKFHVLGNMVQFCLIQISRNWFILKHLKEIFGPLLRSLFQINNLHSKNCLICFIWVFENFAWKKVGPVFITSYDLIWYANFWIPFFGRRLDHLLNNMTILMKGRNWQELINWYSLQIDFFWDLNGRCSLISSNWTVFLDLFAFLATEHESKKIWYLHFDMTESK
jgi:hypothetical protein